MEKTGLKAVGTVAGMRERGNGKASSNRGSNLRMMDP
jgi:hypothetical protein